MADPKVLVDPTTQAEVVVVEPKSWFASKTNLLAAASFVIAFVPFLLAQMDGIIDPVVALKIAGIGNSVTAILAFLVRYWTAGPIAGGPLDPTS